MWIDPSEIHRRVRKAGITYKQMSSGRLYDLWAAWEYMETRMSPIGKRTLIELFEKLLQDSRSK